MTEQHEKGMEQVSLAITTSSEIGDRWCLSQINMIRARLLQETCPNVDAAEASLRMAIDVAQSQSAKGLELRAATLLARLWRDQGKQDEARQLLAPVYGWFTEGFEHARSEGRQGVDRRVIIVSSPLRDTSDRPRSSVSFSRP
jgi:predicted ATPase